MYPSRLLNLYSEMVHTKPRGIAVFQLLAGRRMTAGPRHNLAIEYDPSIHLCKVAYSSRTHTSGYGF